MIGRQEKTLGIGKALLAGVAAVLAITDEAWAEADGPDAWRVIDVAANDRLNVRMGPGTGYPVIGQFAHDARGLHQITCVPLLTPERHFEMTEAERNALPPRWCLMQGPELRIKGWVAQRYLAEDTGENPALASDAQDVVVAAERLVEKLYREHLRALSGSSTSPLHSSRADEFFTAPLAASMASEGVQADPLFDAQDTDITDLEIALDPEQPMLRGMITVNADYRNFGYQRRAVVRLRVEGGSPRVIRIEHEEWSFE